MRFSIPLSASSFSNCQCENKIHLIVTTFFGSQRSLLQFSLHRLLFFYFLFFFPFYFSSFLLFIIIIIWKAIAFAKPGSDLTDTLFCLLFSHFYFILFFFSCRGPAILLPSVFPFARPPSVPRNHLGAMVRCARDLFPPVSFIFRCVTV